MSILSKVLRKTGLNKPLKFVGKAAPYVAGAALIPGVGGMLGGALSKIPAVGGLASKLSGGGGLGGALKSVGKWALSNPDAILGGLSAYQGYQRGKKADSMMDAALNDPALMDESRPDLSDVYAGYSNPYTQPRMRSVGRRVA